MNAAQLPHQIKAREQVTREQRLGKPDRPAAGRAPKPDARQVNLHPRFARQVAGYGRPKYEAFMPRMWRYLDACLADPALAPIKAWYDRFIPAEARR